MFHMSLNMQQIQRRNQAIPLEQAAREAPVLGQLMQQAQLSQACAKSIARLVPAPMRSQLSYGALVDGERCVLVRSNAAAAKLRQLLPLFLGYLQQQGFAVQRIKLRLVDASGQALR